MCYLLSEMGAWPGPKGPHAERYVIRISEAVCAFLAVPVEGIVAGPRRGWREGRKKGQRERGRGWGGWGRVQRWEGVCFVLCCGDR